MLSKIASVRNLGLVFADFSWPADLPAFHKINLIYGWNGCGKTTLTRLFDELASPSGTGIEYEIEMAGGATLATGSAASHQIRVFNQDYIQKNVRVLESTASSISVLLGEQNKDLLAQIEADERELNGDPADSKSVGKIQEHHGFTQKKVRKEKENEDAFTNIARTIGAAIVGSGTGSRTYRKPDAEKDFAQLSIAALLSDAEREAHILALKQDLKSELENLSIPKADDDARNCTDVARGLLDDAKRLAARTVEMESIERLVANPDLASWVETGLHLHSTHKSTGCEFCGSPIPSERLAQLARYFNEADRQLKSDIDGVLADLRKVYSAISSLSVPDSARLYGELQAPYAEAAAKVETASKGLLAQITALGEALKDKKARTNESVMLELSIDASDFETQLTALNAIVDSHNTKSRDFQKSKDKSVAVIKDHYLSTIFDGVKSRSAEVVALESDLATRAQHIDELRRRIATARASISSTHAACDKINEGLRTFLGRQELRFEPEHQPVESGTGGTTDAVVGYRILRGDQPATRLSEGEKTALAFVYFVVHLNDGQFAKADGIVVIDDPISSLDSNSLYQAFSFLKNAVSSCKQVFVLTHNFDFLKLLLNWRSHRRQRGETGYYMITNRVVGDVRRASILEMDTVLRDFESEYHYLFKCLKEMRIDQDGSIMKAYPVPNIARKVWETFLMFRVPSGGSMHAKSEKLKSDGFNPEKLDAIYKFTNDQSHMTGSGFNPALVPETQNVLGHLFEMMQTVAPEHYTILDSSTPIRPSAHAAS